MNSLKFILRIRLALVALLMLAPSLSFSQGSSSISIEFPGGPLSTFVETLQTDKNTDLSIIDPQKLDPILPAFSFQNQEPIAILRALAVIVETQGYLLIPPSHTMAVLRKKDLHASKEGFAVFQLERKLGGGQSIEDITAAIQTACEFTDNDADALRFKFHPGTNMLFVAGPQTTIDRIVRQVIASLPDRRL